MVKDTDLGRLFELATSNTRYVKGLNLHENKNEVSLEYKVEFDLKRSMVMRSVDQKTIIRFRIFDEFEKYINAIGCWLWQRSFYF